MPAYKRAFLYMKGKKGKTILLIITFLIIMTLVLMGMAVNRSSKKAAAVLRERIGGYFKISVDYEKADVRQAVDQTLVEQVKQVDGIKTVNCMNVYFLTTPELDLLPGRYTAEGDSKAKMTSVIGNTASALHEYFLLDMLALEEGSHISLTDEGSVLISRTLADMNELRVGDTFSIKITEDTGVESAAVGMEFPLKIKGIFSEKNTLTGDGLIAECDLPSNYLFVDEKTSEMIYQALYGDGNISYGYGTTFFVKDPKNLEQIVENVQSIKEIEWNSLKLTVNNSAYQRSAEPLERLNSMTSLMVGMILAISVAIVALMLLLWERDRIHEIGVLMSFGIEKRNILLQHFLECLGTYIVAFVLAVAIAIPMSGQMGNKLYDNAVVEAEEQMNESMAESIVYDSMRLDAEEEMTFHAGLQPDAVAYSGIAGILVVGAAVGISFLGIARRRPKEVLTMME